MTITGRIISGMRCIYRPSSGDYFVSFIIRSSYDGKKYTVEFHSNNQRKIDQVIDLPNECDGDITVRGDLHIKEYCLNGWKKKHILYAKEIRYDHW